jgi:hypothetical protein
MQFSNTTTTKDGLIQTCEFWTRHPDAGISGAANLLIQFTARINRGFDRIMPRLLSYTDHIRWDDVNHTDRPVGTINLVSGQADYTISEDDNKLDVLNITAIRILESATGTEYATLERLTLDDPLALDAISPNPSVSGTPSYFLENNGTVFLYPEPDYSATSGIKLYFEREQSYFVSTDTIKEPGIPKPFHELLALYASLDWNCVNRTNDISLKNELKERIFKMEKELDVMITRRNPTKLSMTMKQRNFR